MPTAARFAASSVRPLSNSFQSSPARIATNFVGWTAALGMFLGWPVVIQQYELKVNCKTE